MRFSFSMTSRKTSFLAWTMPSGLQETVREMAVGTLRLGVFLFLFFPFFDL
jgi:hypothetical protein